MTENNLLQVFFNEKRVFGFEYLSFNSIQRNFGLSGQKKSRKIGTAETAYSGHLRNSLKRPQ